jgi:hypothetical protein
MPEPTPGPAPAVIPESRDERVVESTWEAEEFFFGRGSRREPRRR